VNLIDGAISYSVLESQQRSFQKAKNSKGIKLYGGGLLSNLSSTSRRDKKGSLFQRPLVRKNQTESSDHFAHALYCCVYFIHVIRIDSVTWQSKLSAKRVQIVVLPYLSAATMQLFRFSG